MESKKQKSTTQFLRFRFRFRTSTVFKRSSWRNHEKRNNRHGVRFGCWNRNGSNFQRRPPPPLHESEQSAELLSDGNYLILSLTHFTPSALANVGVDELSGYSQEKQGYRFNRALVSLNVQWVRMAFIAQHHRHYAMWFKTNVQSKANLWPTQSIRNYPWQWHRDRCAESRQLTVIQVRSTMTTQDLLSGQCLISGRVDFRSFSSLILFFNFFSPCSSQSRRPTWPTRIRCSRRTCSRWSSVGTVRWFST